MTYDARTARAALMAFQTSTGLQDFPWEKAAGVGEGTLRQFRTGKSRSMSAATYAKLAAAASEILGAAISSAQLRGEAALLRRVGVAGKIGAGAQVFPFDGDSAIDQLEAPPGFDASTGVALIVEGESGAPLFEPGDVLFVGPGRRDVAAFIGKVVAVQVKNGPRLVKRLMRGRKALYDLMSINPASGVLVDQAALEVAAIEWIHRKG